MKTELKTRWFTESGEVADFVNGNGIARGNIHAITSIGGVF